MNYVFAALVALVCLFWSPQSLDSKELTETPPIEETKKTRYVTTADILQLIKTKSLEYGVNETDMYRTIGCETKWTFDPTIRAEAILWYGREESYGLAQIHLPDHPTVTKEMAQDPYFAVDFMAKNLKKNGSWWVCYQNL